MRAAGLAGMLPPLAGRFPDAAPQHEWEIAITDVADELGLDDTEATEATEATDKLVHDLRLFTWATLSSQLLNAAGSPELGTGLVQAMREATAVVAASGDHVPADSPSDIGSDAFAETLRYHAAAVIGPTIPDAAGARACELARAWGGSSLDMDVKRLSDTGPPGGSKGLDRRADARLPVRRRASHPRRVVVAGQWRHHQRRWKHRRFRCHR